MYYHFTTMTSFHLKTDFHFTLSGADNTLFLISHNIINSTLQVIKYPHPVYSVAGVTVLLLPLVASRFPVGRKKKVQENILYVVWPGRCQAGGGFASVPDGVE